MAKNKGGRPPEEKADFYLRMQQLQEARPGLKDSQAARQIAGAKASKAEIDRVRKRFGTLKRRGDLAEARDPRIEEIHHLALAQASQTENELRQAKEDLARAIGAAHRAGLPTDVSGAEEAAWQLDQRRKQLKELATLPPDIALRTLRDQGVFGPAEVRDRYKDAIEDHAETVRKLGLLSPIVRLRGWIRDLTESDELNKGKAKTSRD